MLKDHLLKEENDDDDSDVERYDSLLDPDPKEDDYISPKLRKQLDKAFKGFEAPPVSMFDVRPAAKAFDTFVPREAPRPLFWKVWRERELAVMFGEPASGKNIFGVQLAEALSRGLMLPPRARKKFDPLTVLYIDLETPEHEFARRYYDARSQKPYAFAGKFLRTSDAWNRELPNAFRSFTDYALFSIEEEIMRRRPNAVVINNLAHLCKLGLRNASSVWSVLKNLRSIMHATRTSILVIAPSKTAAGPKPIKLTDLPSSNVIAEIADSVFAVCRSPFAPDIRYIKAFKCGSGAVAHTQRLPVYRIERMETADAALAEAPSDPDISEWIAAPEFRLPRVSPRINAGRAILIESAMDIVRKYEASVKTLPAPSGAFVGFRHVGDLDEPAHFRTGTEFHEDIEHAFRIKRMAAAGIAPHIIEEILFDTPAAIRRRIPDNTIEFLLSPHYGRYLNP